MARRVPVRVGSRPEPELAGPRPFSSEWHATPPEMRTPQVRRSRSLPGWIPSAPILSAALVLLLVLTTTVVSGSLAPVTTATVKSGGTVGQVIDAPSGGSSEGGKTVSVVNPPAEATEEPDAEPTLIPTPDPADEGDTTAPALDVTPQVGGSTPDADPRAILPKYRIVAYYGHPFDTNMGILGEFSMDELYDELMDTVAAWEAADPTRPVMPAFELIASVAQNWPADNDTYLLHTDSDTIQQYVDYTREKGILLILDLQIGHSSVPAEMDIVREWLYEPHVMLAIDPEFSMAEGEIPGEAIGGVTASEISYAQQELSEIVVENDLPPKVLVVHQFEENMIMQPEEIQRVPHVQTVIDFDGWGDPATKIFGYNLFIQQPHVEFAGIKLFYRQDDPLMSPEEVLQLEPPPDYVQYA